MLRILFAGTPECAIPSLEIIAKHHTLVGVLTNPPAASGRSGTKKECPVACKLRSLIDENVVASTVPILDPKSITQEVRDSIAALKPDLLVCFAYGKIFSAQTLSLFPLGGINIHPSLLPRWRGCAPVPAAILAQDSETGVSIQKLALKMDSGDILGSITIPLDGSETAEKLLQQSSIKAAALLQDILEQIKNGTTNPVSQDESKATYSCMIQKKDGEISWELPATHIDAQIRAFTPWPASFSYVDDKMLIIHKAHPILGENHHSSGKIRGTIPGNILGIDKQEGILIQTGEGILAVEQLQWQTKKILDWKSFINGNKDIIGKTLSRATPSPSLNDEIH